jgi:hypothetical protein
MELNYLEPEPFVYLSGLAALYTIARHSNLSRSLPWLCAGVWISLGCVFKMVAAFYLGGLYLFLIVCLLRSQLTLRQGLRCASWSTLGFALVFVPQILYFHLSGRLHSFIEWTLIYPAFHTPGNTVFLSKLFTKLIWFPMLLIGAVCLSWSPKVRNPILGDHTAVLALCLGLVSFGSLCKSQASHYYFPGAAMCCLFITRVFVLYGRTAFQRLSTRWFAVTTAALAAAIGVSVYTYNPSATARLFTLRSFDAEQRFGAAVDRLTGPATFIAFRNPVLLYWITRKYPVVPIVNTEHQSTAWLETHGQELIAALDNPKLTLVEFDPVSPSIDDFRKLTPAHMRPLLHMFALKLRQGFDPLRPGNDYVFWVRKSMDSSGSAVHLPTRM